MSETSVERRALPSLGETSAANSRFPMSPNLRTADSRFKSTKHVQRRNALTKKNFTLNYST